MSSTLGWLLFYLALAGVDVLLYVLHDKGRLRLRWLAIGVVATFGLAAVSGTWDWGVPYRLGLGAAAGALSVGAFFVGRRLEQNPKAAIEGIPWVDLETRFKELRDRDYATRVNSSGPLGAHQVLDGHGQLVWWVSGQTDELREGAKRLCALAGRKLLESPALLKGMRAERQVEDLERWLWLLVDLGFMPSDERGEYSQFGRGVKPLTIHMYQTDRLMDHSMAACLECVLRLGPTKR